MRARQAFLLHNNLPVEDHAYASEDKATRVSIVTHTTYSLSDIHALHRRDDVLSFVGGLIPGVGTILGPLSSVVGAYEQGNTPVTGTLKNIAITAIGLTNETAGFIASVVDSLGNMFRPKSATYQSDGVVIQENDTYVLLYAETDQGLTTTAIRMYIRSEEIISYEQIGPAERHGAYPQYDMIIRARWKKAGYK